MIRARRRPRAVRFGRSLIAGVGAGAVAALAVLGAASLMHARIPPPTPAAGSAFAAGVLGGILFWLLSLGSRRAVLWLWVASLFAATAISLVVALLPRASLPLPHALFFMAGLLGPLGQILALLGAAKFGSGHFPPQGLQAAITMHYVVAVATCLLVPWWARPAGAR